MFESILNDCIFSPYPERKSGGQTTGTSCGVKIVHEPTGLTAISYFEISQHKNKQIALHMIEGGLTSPAISWRET